MSVCRAVSYLSAFLNVNVDIGCLHDADQRTLSFENGLYVLSKLVVLSVAEIRLYRRGASGASSAVVDNGRLAFDRISLSDGGKRYPYAPQYSAVDASISCLRSSPRAILGRAAFSLFSACVSRFAQK